MEYLKTLEIGATGGEGGGEGGAGGVVEDAIETHMAATNVVINFAPGCTLTYPSLPKAPGRFSARMTNLNRQSAADLNVLDFL